jgi:mannosyltransferase
MGAARPGGPGAAGRATRAAVRGFWLWPALLTLGLGLARLGRPALWADELATWGTVRLSWGGLFRLLDHADAVIGPYYVVEKAWTALTGTSTVALRLPSVLAMTVAAALVATLGARLGGSRWPGLLAGLGFALVPATSRYAQEARPYAFTILFAVLATLLLAGLLERPATGRAARYALVILLLGAAHLIGVLLLVGHAVAVLLRRDRGLLARWLVAAGVPVLILAPLAWLGHRQRAQVAWIGPAHWRTLIGAPAVIFGDAGVGGALVVLAVLGLARTARGGSRPAILLAGWAIGPVAALYVAGTLTPAFFPRYLLYTMPASVLLAAIFLGRTGRYRAVAVLAVIGLLGAPAQASIRGPAGHNHDTAGAAAIIAAGERPGDAIVYALHEPVVPWEARDIVARYVPADRRPRDVFAVTPQRVDGRLTAIECPDLAGCLAAADPDRIWVLRYQSRPDPLDGIGEPKESLLRSHFRLAHVWLVNGLTVGLLTR